jgi:hypothetical protein
MSAYGTKRTLRDVRYLSAFGAKRTLTDSRFKEGGFDDGLVDYQTTSDNRANSFTLDLLNDPYWVGSAQPGGIGGRIMNWFADKSPPGTLPTGVAVIDGANSASIAGSVVTVNVPIKPSGFVYHVVMDLLFG